MNFDRLVAVDWSAAARPVTGPDSLWVAVAARGRIRVTNPSTRAGWAAELRRRVLTWMAREERVLVGVDAALGYPVGFADLVAPGADGPPWRRVWEAVAAEVNDDDRNANDRFEAAARINRRLGGPGPFWGRPPGRELDGLSPTRVALAGGLTEWRRTEALARARGQRVQSTWKLWGVGSVGGQTLLALHWLQRLRTDPEVGRHLRIWPFEAGPTRGATIPAPDTTVPGVWVVEVWPPAVPPDRTRSVRDAAQVAGLVRAWAAAGRRRVLERWFELGVIDEAGRRQVGEEGWIVGPPGPPPPGSARG